MAATNDKQLYLKATQEVDNGSQVPTLWAKAMALAEGDEGKARYRYITLRVEELSKASASAPPEDPAPIIDSSDDGLRSKTGNSASAGATPRGIYGWLVIPAIALVFGPILHLFINWLAWTAPDLFADMRLVLCMTMDTAMLVATIVVAVLFFQTKRIAVPAFIGLMVAGIANGLIKLLVTLPIFDEVYWKSVVRPCVYASVWIPYFLKSKRVRNTFVN